MSVSTGCCVSRSRIALTMDVTGWYSAKAPTRPGMVSVETEPMVNQIRCATRETRWPLSRVSACVT
jgi:hypothetical protein